MSPLTINQRVTSLLQFTTQLSILHVSHYNCVNGTVATYFRTLIVNKLFLTSDILMSLSMATTTVFPTFGSDVTQSRVLHAVRNVQPHDGASAPLAEIYHSGSKQ